MLNRKLHPEILGYYKEMDQILEKNNVSFLSEFRKRILDEEPKFIFLWLDELLQKNLLPPEIDNPLTNLYWSIR